jgi:phage terminase small subunit
MGKEIKARPLTLKQRVFVREYLKHSNATQAALTAGYSKKTAPFIGAQNLKKDSIIEALAAKADSVLKKLDAEDVTIARVVAEFAKLGFANMQDFIQVQKDGSAYCDLSNLTRDQAAAIQEINTEEYIEGKGEDGRLVKKVKVKLHDKKGALDSLGKYLKMFIDRMEHTGKDGGPIVTKAEEPDLSGLTDDELIQLRDLSAKIKNRTT